MAYQFTSTENHRYEAGDFFLGLDENGHKVGISTERHGLTIAGAGSGKGAALIIPNLLRWPHNALVVDPKGENAEATWKAREAMGQRVYVLDPFKVANVPDRLRASCNLLAGIRPDSLTAREDIRVIADGMVMRYKADDATWDNGAVSVLSGMIGYVCADPSPEGRNLPAVRQLLTLPPDTLQGVFADMAETDTFGGLCKGAASIGLSDTRKNKEFVGGAVDHSEWLDSPAMASALTGEGFDLSELKTGKATVYLVLPPQYLGEHGRFLRLFVRAALDAMAKGLKGEKCLFLLDEFFALGRIDEIAKAAGLMRGYGVQLWPFLQDLGQLKTLYGQDAAHTFFGNADLHVFFGNTDAPTLAYISKSLGAWTSKELGEPPLQQNPGRMVWSAGGGFHEAVDQSIATFNQNRMNEYAHTQRQAGAPRMPPEEVRETVAKKDGDKIARHMIVFAKGGAIFLLKPEAYFAPVPSPSTGDEPLPVPEGRTDIESMPSRKDSLFDHTPPPDVEGWRLGYADRGGMWVYENERTGKRIQAWTVHGLAARGRYLDETCRRRIYRTVFNLPTLEELQEAVKDGRFWQAFRKDEFVGYNEEYDSALYAVWRDEMDDIKAVHSHMVERRIYWCYLNDKGYYFDAGQACGLYPHPMLVRLIPD